jgi:hypothetical protein
MKIESRIYGAFAGWHGDALFKLTNGQYWLQAEYKYKYKYRPEVVITRTGNGYEMEVEDMGRLCPSAPSQCHLEQYRWCVPFRTLRIISRTGTLSNRFGCAGSKPRRN